MATTKWHVVVTAIAGGTVARQRTGTPEDLVKEIMKSGFWADDPKTYVPAASIAQIEFLPTD